MEEMQEEMEEMEEMQRQKGMSDGEGGGRGRCWRRLRIAEGLYSGTTWLWPSVPL